MHGKKFKISSILFKTVSLLFCMILRPKAQTDLFINLFLKTEGILSDVDF